MKSIQLNIPIKHLKLPINIFSHQQINAVFQVNTWSVLYIFLWCFSGGAVSLNSQSRQYNYSFLIWDIIHKLSRKNLWYFYHAQIDWNAWQCESVIIHSDTFCKSIFFHLTHKWFAESILCIYVTCCLMSEVYIGFDY